ncbi:MAG: DUF5678 domain-containing protein [Chloroflexota bacterium]
MDVSDSQPMAATVSPTERQTWARSYRNWDWINAHPEVLEQYRGQYIAIFDQQVVASGHDHRAFRAALEASPYGDAIVLMLRVPRRDEVDGILAL